jgi:hypothetical protein
MPSLSRRFNFEDDLIFDDEIGNVLADSRGAVLELDDARPFEADAAMRQLDAQSNQIGLLEEGRSKVFMHFDRTAMMRSVSTCS